MIKSVSMYNASVTIVFFTTHLILLEHHEIGEHLSFSPCRNIFLPDMLDY